METAFPQNLIIWSNSCHKELAKLSRDFHNIWAGIHIAKMIMTSPNPLRKNRKINIPNVVHYIFAYILTHTFSSLNCLKTFKNNFFGKLWWCEVHFNYVKFTTYNSTYPKSMEKALEFLAIFWLYYFTVVFKLPTKLDFKQRTTPLSTQ